MAYAGENEHKEYMDYVINEQSNGRTPLSKEEWRKKKGASNDSQGVKTTAMSEY